MKIQEIISEKRKNPESNKKQSLIDQLMAYSNDDTLFIHFTNHIQQGDPKDPKYPMIDKVFGKGSSDQIKLGINPGHDYKTPLGIYAYHLKSFIEKNSDKLTGYATSMPYVYLFRIKSGNVKDVHEYTDKDLSNDISKLKDMYQSINIDWLLKKTTAANPAKKFWELTKAVVDQDTKKWNYLLRKLGYNGFIDKYGEVFQYPQSVFLSRDVIQVVDLLRGSVVNQPVSNLTDKSEVNINVIHRIDNAISNHKRDKPLEKYIIQLSNGSAMRYFSGLQDLFVDGKWNELEQSSDISQLIKYVQITGNRIPSREDEILRYAKRSNVSKYVSAVRSQFPNGRWKELEQVLLSNGDSELIMDYANNIIKNRWPEAEDILKAKRIRWNPTEEMYG